MPRWATPCTYVIPTIVRVPADILTQIALAEGDHQVNEGAAAGQRIHPSRGTRLLRAVLGGPSLAFMFHVQDLIMHADLQSKIS
jgi:hypothetical protein